MSLKLNLQFTYLFERSFSLVHLTSSVTQSLKGIIRSKINILPEKQGQRMEGKNRNILGPE